MKIVGKKAIFCLITIMLLIPISASTMNLKVENDSNTMSDKSSSMKSDEMLDNIAIISSTKNLGRGDTVKLPRPRYDSDTSIETALLKRRSVREYAGESLTLEEVSQLLWAAQGITSLKGFRTSPSAGALYPLEIFLVVGEVEDLDAGVYRYKPVWHGLRKVLDGDIREELADAALGQEWVKEGAIDIIITAVYERTTQKYGDRGIRYVHIEVGCVVQSIYLQAVALDLGTVCIGAFYDTQVKNLIDIEEDPLIIMPVGRIKEGIPNNNWT
jgi:SagB-type dehydrogenase family enzyme